MIWLKVAKDILHCDKDLLICTCYVLSSNSCRSNITTCDVFRQLTNDIFAYSHTDDHVCIMAGDLNVRTWEHNDGDILKMYSQDKVMNLNGGDLLQCCKLSIFWIPNGRIGKDNRTGKYTYCGSSERIVVLLIICYLNNVIFHILPILRYFRRLYVRIIVTCNCLWNFKWRIYPLQKIYLKTECSDGIMKKLMLIKTN